MSDFDPEMQNVHARDSPTVEGLVHAYAHVLLDECAHPEPCLLLCASRRRCINFPCGGRQLGVDGGVGERRARRRRNGSFESFNALSYIKKRTRDSHEVIGYLFQAFAACLVAS